MRIASSRLSRGKSVLLLALALTSGFAFERSALAQTPEELSEARAAFQRGIELEQAKNWGGALKMFRQVGQVRMTPQVRYHIALCEEKLGKLVAALGGYELALADAESVGDGVSFKQEVEASVNDLRARIPKVVIRRGEGAEAAAIELDGVALGESSVGVEVPLDPGPHSLAATAQGHRDYSETLEVAEEETRTVTITLEPLPSDDPPDDPIDPIDSGVDKKSASGYGFYPYVMLGVGGAAMATSGVLFFAVRQPALSLLKEECTKVDDDHYSCNEFSDERKARFRKKDHQVRTLNWLSPTLLGVGAAIAGAGGVMLYLDSTDKKQGAAPNRAHVALTPAAPGADVAGVSVSGQF